MTNHAILSRRVVVGGEHQGLVELGRRALGQSSGRERSSGTLCRSNVDTPDLGRTSGAPSPPGHHCGCQASSHCAPPGLTRIHLRSPLLQRTGRSSAGLLMMLRRTGSAGLNQRCFVRSSGTPSQTCRIGRKSRMSGKGGSMKSTPWSAGSASMMVRVAVTRARTRRDSWSYLRLSMPWMARTFAVTQAMSAIQGRDPSTLGRAQITRPWRKSAVSRRANPGAAL